MGLFCRNSYSLLRRLSLSCELVAEPHVGKKPGIGPRLEDHEDEYAWAAHGRRCGEPGQTMASTANPSRGVGAACSFTAAYSVSSLGGAFARGAETEKPAPATLSQIDTALRDATLARRVPGVVAMAATDNGIIYEGAFGSRHLGQGPAMSHDTVFRIASMIKAGDLRRGDATRRAGQDFARRAGACNRPGAGLASGAYRFRYRGAPQLRPAKQPITLRHLLTHTAGFAYRLWDVDALRYANAIDRLPARQRALLPRSPLMFDPGTRWQYGTNIDWVGRIVEAVSGERLDEYFRKHILGPLGMADTGFVVSPAQRARQGERAPAQAGRPWRRNRWRSRPRRRRSPAAAASIRPPRLPDPPAHAAATGADSTVPAFCGRRRSRSWARIRSAISKPEFYDDESRALERRRFLSAHSAAMGSRPHDQHGAGAGRSQRRQPHLGRSPQYLLLDRSDEARRRRLHDAGSALC